MDYEASTTDCEMTKHPDMTVRAQALAYKDAKMSVATISSKTGMSNSALHRLFKAAKAAPVFARPNFAEAWLWPPVSHDRGEAP